MKVVKSTTARAPPPLSLATPPLAHCSDRGHYGSEEERRRYLAQQMLPPIRDEGTSPAVSRCTAGMVERLRITLENRLFFSATLLRLSLGLPRTRHSGWVYGPETSFGQKSSLAPLVMLPRAFPNPPLESPRWNHEMVVCLSSLWCHAVPWGWGPRSGQPTSCAICQFTFASFAHSRKKSSWGQQGC